MYVIWSALFLVDVMAEVVADHQEIFQEDAAGEVGNGRGCPGPGIRYPPKMLLVFWSSNHPENVTTKQDITIDDKATRATSLIS
jgi:hypothetical protein